MTKGAVFGGNRFCLFSSFFFPLLSSGAEVFFHRALRSAPLSEGWAEVLAGGMAGFAQGLSLSPLLLLKTRVMTDSVLRSSASSLSPLALLAASVRLGSRVAAQGELMKVSRRKPPLSVPKPPLSFV